MNEMTDMFLFTIPPFLEQITLYKIIFVFLGVLHLRAGLAYVLNPQKKDTYLSDGYSFGMTKDMGAHLWWLGCMLIALAFVQDAPLQKVSCILLIIGLIVPILAEFQNIHQSWQSKSALPRIILKVVFAGLAGIWVMIV
jgi:hypothetical protein